MADRGRDQEEAATTTGAPLRFDHRCIWPDGSVHWVEGRGTIAYDESGAVVGGAGIALGIDARRAFLRLSTALSSAATTRDIANALSEHGVSALDADISFVVFVDDLDAALASSDQIAAGRASHAQRALDAGEPVILNAIGEVQPFEGAHELLEEVKRRGFRLVLASSGQAQHVEAFLDLVGGKPLADAWTTSEDAEKSKPEPDLVRTALASVET